MKDGVLQDGHTLHVSIMLKDGATIPGGRKDLAMMTDTEVRTMRDSVHGMPIGKAASLPIYDNVRGGVMSGMAAERYCAMVDGADVSDGEYTADMARRDAAHDHMTDKLRNAWKHDPVNDNRFSAPQFARDGRPMSELSESDRAREEMIARQSGAWRK